MNTNRTAETHSAKKHLRRTLPAALVLLAICLVFTAPVAAWGENYDTETSFTISSEADLLAFAQMVNSGNDFYEKTVTLTQDISLSGEWTPIGNSKSFSGVFDGGGHTISGMTITQINNRYLGLFGCTEPSATIKNLNVKGSINIILTSEDYTPLN